MIETRIVRVAALITKQGKVVCGANHGIAYSQLTEEERMEVISGFVVEDKFFTEDCRKAFEMKELMVIRHGQSKHNVHLTNDLDAEITQRGYEQCLVTAHYLKNLPDIGDYYGFTSPYLRCLQTSSIISLITGVKFKIDPRFKENPCLMPEQGLPVLKRSKEFPNIVGWEEYKAHFYTTENKIYFFKFYPEEPQIYLENIKNAIADLPPKSIIVSHGTPVMIIAEMAQGSQLEDIPPWDITQKAGWIENASVTHIKNQQLLQWSKVPE